MAEYTVTLRRKTAHGTWTREQDIVQVEAYDWREAFEKVDWNAQGTLWHVVKVESDGTTHWSEPSLQHGGPRPGAGRKPSYKRIQLTDYQAELLGKLIDDAELIDHPTTANVIVGTILREALTNDYKRWVETFRQTAQGSQQKALDGLRDYAQAPAPELPQAARALIATLTPQREPVATIYRRLNWGRQMLEQTISQHRAELERAGLRLHVATHSEASGRLDRYITVDGTRYSTLSRE